MPKTNPAPLFRKHGFWLLLFTLLLIAEPIFSQTEGKISRLGEYHGYSIIAYDSWVRSSLYLTMRDGIKLAADIIRPAHVGKPAEKPLPVVWTHTRYRRATEQDGRIISQADSPAAQLLLKHGYNIAVVDVRGSGASFGSWQGIFTPEESRDAYEITEWLASQSWCDGNVGMFGGSYLGITQLMAASTKPPHLKAIFPMVALFDMYALGFAGGVFYEDLIRTWSELTYQLDNETPAVAVDADQDKSLLSQALAAHRSSRSLLEIFAPLPFRDSRDEYTGALPHQEWHPAGVIREINESGIPVYLFCGWFDSFTRDGFLLFQNITAPKKIIMGAWSHSPRDPKIRAEEFELLAIEQLRWFDFWLKGINNGIMDENPITFHVMKAPGQNEWREAASWPLTDTLATKYYFHTGPSDSPKSGKNGLLKPDAPQSDTGRDEYTVDYTTTSGTTTRWDNAVGGDFGYPDMTANDIKGLTYTSSSLEKDTEITGHPVVHVWISSTAGDADFFAYLEEVDSNGFSHYITEGVLRASHRAQHDPPYDNPGLPYHRSFAKDTKELTPGEPVELVFDLHPTSNIFNAGHRIRLTITCADKDNAFTPVLSPVPMISLYCNSRYTSFISLPVIIPFEDTAVPMIYIILIILVLITTIVLLVPKIINKGRKPACQ